MPISKCTVSGNVHNLLDAGVGSATVTVFALTPFIHTNILIVGQQSSTITDSTGFFTLDVIETETVSQRLSFVFEYSNGISGTKRKQYDVVVPNTASADITAIIVANASPPIIVPTFPALYVTVVPTGNLASTNAQDALVELQTDIDAINAANHGDVTLTPVGSSPNANAASLSVQALTLQPADTNFPGVLLAADWNTFNNKFDLPVLTSGSVLFSDGTTIAQDNANIFWDNTNKRLGIGNNTPPEKLSVSGNIKVTGDLKSFGSTSGTFNQKAAAVTATYFVTWPSAQASVDDLYLNNDGAGNLNWTPLTARNVSDPTVVTATQGLRARDNATASVFLAGYVDGTKFSSFDGFPINTALFTTNKIGSSAWCAVHSAQPPSTDTTNDSGGVSISSGAVTNVTSVGATGLGLLYSGANYGLGLTGDLQILTGDIINAGNSSVTGSMFIQTGSSSGSGNTGDINLSTGTSGGVRGSINIAAQQLNINAPLVSSTSMEAVSLTLDGSTSGKFTQEAANVTTDYTIKWPSSQGAASTVPTNDGSGNLTWSPAVSSTPVSARYHSTNAQSVTNGNVINYEVSDFDTNSIVTTGASWVATIPVAGKYMVGAKTNGSGGALSTGLYIRQNGTRKASSFTPGAATVYFNQVSTLLNCAVNDTIDVEAFTGGYGLSSDPTDNVFFIYQVI